MWMSDGGHMGDWGWGIAGMIMMAIFWIGALLVIVYVLRGLVHPNDANRSSRDPDSRAVSILQERYARGEIDREEFEERRRTLLNGA